MSVGEHTWLWGILVYVDDREAEAIARGERRTFRKLDPYDRQSVQGAAVFCEDCQRPYVEAVGEPCYRGRTRGSALVLPDDVR